MTTASTGPAAPGPSAPDGVGGPVFRVLLRMELHPGAAAEFERVWRSGAHVVADHPANLQQWLARSTDDSDVYFIMSDWHDEERFREFERSQAHLEHRATLHPYRRVGSFTTMRVLYAVGDDVGNLR